jgi:hypothetical protein
MLPAKDLILALQGADTVRSGAGCEPGAVKYIKQQWAEA